MPIYEFNAERVFECIREHMLRWVQQVGAEYFVVGISGGKDSAVVAALLVRLFGREHTLGVLLPNGEQKDIDDARAVTEFLQIPSVELNIGGSCDSLLSEIQQKLPCPLTDACRINLPARLRMTALFAVAQCVPRAYVINTSNLSEDVVGYATQFGDNAGCYAPIQQLTVTEVKALGIRLGLPEKMIHKIPADGLQDSSDEERLGFTYAALDRFIRLNDASEEFAFKIRKIYAANKFKQDIVQMPHPSFDFPNFIISSQP